MKIFKYIISSIILFVFISDSFTNLVHIFDFVLQKFYFVLEYYNVRIRLVVKNRLDSSPSRFASPNVLNAVLIFKNITIVITTPPYASEQCLVEIWTASNNEITFI